MNEFALYEKTINCNINHKDFNYDVITDNAKKRMDHPKILCNYMYV